MLRKTIGEYRNAIELVEPVPIRFFTNFRYRIREDLGPMDGLIRSISEVGLLQPIIARPIGNSFEIIAGHRRLEACRQLRWRQVPAIVKDVQDKEAFEIYMSENIQRSTLNPIEEAKAFSVYVSQNKWGSITELAHRIGKSEAYVSHRILLLRLPANLQAKISNRVLNPTLARELNWIKDEELQKALASYVEENELSVREAHSIAASLKKGGSKEDLDISEIIEELNFSASEKKQEENRKLLNRSILILKMTLIRMDQIIEECESKELRNFLLTKRLLIHGVIDECVKSIRDREV